MPSEEPSVRGLPAGGNLRVKPFLMKFSETWNSSTSSGNCV